MIVIDSEKLPIKVWAGGIDGEDAVFGQARNLANHPLARTWVCLMPDYHLGYGMPIGGVLATQGGVVPNAVGVDIGCGMIAARTNLRAGELARETLQELRAEIHRRVPVGQAHHKAAQPMPLRLSEIPHGRVVGSELGRAAYQIGTLGGGNHFIEVQHDEQDRVWIMLHSGSRNIGLKVCNAYHAVAKEHMKRFHSPVPDMDLAFLPDNLQEYGEYMTEMQWCMAFAEENRERMFTAIVQAFEGVGMPVEIVDKFDTHHNFAQMERHYGDDVLIHRKGAVRAAGFVTIPGSMGTASYIGRGLEPRESFCTCAHGAGRAIGRRQANRIIRHEEAVEAMQHVVFGVRPGNYDEMPRCYKDIDAVMSLQADLVEPVHRLLPMAVVKG